MEGPGLERDGRKLISLPPSLHHSCLISCLRVRIRFLYSDIRIFLPSTMHVRFGLGRYLEIEEKKNLYKYLGILRIFGIEEVF